MNTEQTSKNIFKYKTCQANQRIPLSAPIHNWERTAKPRV